MKVNFARTEWANLKEIRNDIRERRISERGMEVAKNLLIGLADAIDAEIRLIELDGKHAEGGVTLSVDLIVVTDPEAEYLPPRKINLLQELDDILNGRTT